MFFDKSKGAFRAGSVSGTEWDDGNVGNYSVALGSATTASGQTSTALGNSTVASGTNSTAMGSYAQANGNTSIAMGAGVEATGDYSVAIGLSNAVSGTSVPANTMAIMGGWVGIGVASPTVELDVSGDIKANTVTYTSDEKWKKNIETLPDSLEKILALRGVNYDWRVDEYMDKKFSSDKQIGLIAQEVEKVFPEVVNTSGDGKTVDYASLVAPLIEAVKAQQKQIEKLKQEIELLKGKK